MRPGLLAILLVVLFVGATLVTFPLSAPGTRAAAGSGAVTGNLTGKTVLAYDGVAEYSVRGTGGPAVASNGTIVGNLSFYLSVTGPNTTGVSVAPDRGKILTGFPGRVSLTVSNVSEVLTISVLLASTLNQSNESTNFTFSVTVVQPYVLSTTLYNLGSSSVTSFLVLVALDGTPVGNVSVPTMLPHTTFHFEFQYATVGLPAGDHTFTVYLSTVHGLVRFSNGTTVYSVTFTLPGPPPSYTLWYVTGAVAFIGALFIFGARVGARRRGTSKK
ncbi:MAG TPA: hypothetical protein VN842_00545 [Thermoplasmata archaeon]|nr:hypothetical protein [Thermoplasmata archaeon]